MSRVLTIQTDELLDDALRERARSRGKSVPETALEILSRALLHRPKPAFRCHEQEGKELKRELPPLSSREREHAWRRSNRQLLQDRYSAEWVVLEGEKVVAHGRDAVRAVEEARAKGVAAPYLFYVQPPRPPGTVRIGL